jgi:hypothetical protein
MMRRLAMLLPLVIACGGADDGTADEDLTGGVNGAACNKTSPYNCKLRASGGNRIETNTPGDETWGIDQGATILDGDGNALGIEKGSSLEFNYGQVRDFGGQPHAFAMTTSNGSSGWFPISAIGGATSFTQKVGHVSAHGEGLAKLACYEVRNASDTTLEPKKVVYDTTDAHQRAGDYMPLVRANGKRSVNLAFNVPGFGLGGVAVDHFAAGTKFQRLDVPTKTGAPSIDIPLWVKDGAGRYRKQDGTMKFVYGYVIAKTGTKRVGWMAYEALETSNQCP